MDNIYKYRLFLKTIETGNITRTAESFYVSQSAVSQQLKHLEEYFGKELFYKDKTLKLTAFGMSIKDEVEQLVSYYEHKENFIFNVSKNEDLSLNIIAKSSFILNILNRFLTKNPLDINALRNGSNLMICEEINSGRSHIGFGDLGNAYRNLESIQVLDIPIVLVVHKSNPLAKKKDVLVEDLKKQTMILYDDKTFIGNYVQDMFIEKKTYPKRVIRCNHSEMIQMLAQIKFGIGFIYGHTADSINNKDLVYRQLKNFSIKKPYSLIYNPKFINQYQQQVIENMVTFFKKENKKLGKL